MRLSLPIPGLGAGMGVGDLIKTATTKLGIRPCGDCNRRAAALNRVLEIRSSKTSAHKARRTGL